MPEGRGGRWVARPYWIVVSFCLVAGVAIASFAGVRTAAAQGFGGRGGGAPQAPQAAQAGAPVDLTGYWVSIVTEDWIERMSPDSRPSGTGGGVGAGRGGQRP